MSEATCPFIVHGDDGTSYCKLAEAGAISAKEMEALTRKLEVVEKKAAKIKGYQTFLPSKDLQNAFIRECDALLIALREIEEEK